MKYYAHSIQGEDKEKWQSLSEHLTNTANLVVEFSANFCESEYAKNLGLLHDIGKYQIAFQKRLDGSKTPVEHAVYGAIEWNKLGLPESGAYCIVGHHGGLPDIGTDVDTAEASSLIGRIKRGRGENAEYSKFNDEIKLEILKKFPAKNSINKENQKLMKIEYAFWTRMMFSCLTDADYIDTERFYNSNVNRGNTVDFNKALSQINKKIDSFSCDTQIKKVRNNLRLQAINNSKTDSECYFLNMPTGSGKTLTSMQFALNRAVQKQKKRIIYVIPFTSIIEQNAKVFKDIFGANSVLEHHSNFDYDSINDESIKAKLMRASENWDSDIIVTTNVQFFESIYSNKTSKVRKLHNIADSIILFDEVHMLPTMYFKPCLDAIRILTQRYNCEAVFMTATMPDFDKWLVEFDCNNMKTCDLIADKSEFNKFNRCEIKDLKSISMEKLIATIQENNNTLLVVNKKSTANEIYDNLAIKKYHLTTYMTHNDRDITIDKVRKSLALGEQFCLVSTSLIEAGVDLDFDVTFRELDGLENLLQTAGRCNREGKKENSVSYSFSFEEERLQRKDNDIKIKQSITNEVFAKYEDVASNEAIKYYFDRLYSYWNETMQSYAFENAINSNCCNKEGVGFNFRSYADEFKLIDESTTSVVIKNDEVLELIENQLFYDMSIKRKLQKHTLNLREYELKKLVDVGVIEVENGITFLSNSNYYNENTGITFEDNNDYIF